MIEAVRINLKDKEDTEFIIGKILSQINSANRTENVEILEEFFKYNLKSPVLRIFVE